MQVDRRNFIDQIDGIIQLINKASFIAFDCQFTGLVTQRQQIQGLYPDYNQFYQRIKETALNFNLLQLGITIFQYRQGSYHPKAFNFYVNAIKRQSYNQMIVAQWGSLQFLAKNNMDFSKAFKFGISYKRITQNKEFKQDTNPLQRQNHLEHRFFNQKDKEIVQSIYKMIDPGQKICVDFEKKSIFDYFKNKYDLILDKNKNNKKYQYQVKWIKSQNIHFQNHQQTYVQKQDQICQQWGLQLVIDAIIKSKRPIVGHFCNLDIGLIYHAFIGELPQTYQQFSKNLNNLFPFIFDTKVISTRVQSRIKSIKVDLKSLYKDCFRQKSQLRPYVNINFDCVEQYAKTQSSHEAGFDSYMTGCAFVAMINFLHQVKQKQFEYHRLQNQNKHLYSKFVGQVSLKSPQYLGLSQFNKRRISFNWKQMGQQLSQYGSLLVNEDHNETYFVFDEEVDVEKILEGNKKLVGYDKRRIIRSRNMFKC